MPLDETSSTTSERARNAASASAETCVETAKPCPLVDQRAACPNGPKILRRGKPARELEGHLFANGLDLALDHLVMFAEPLDQFAHEQFGRRRARRDAERADRSEEHTSELQSLMRISYAVFCLKKKKKQQPTSIHIR